MDREALEEIKTAILDNKASRLVVLLDKVSFKFLEFPLRGVDKPNYIWQVDNNNADYLSVIESITSKEIVEFLQNHSDNVNIKNYPYSHCLFSYVCSFAKASVVKMLIDLGANLKSKHEFGDVPIKLAFESGRKDLINLLLHENLITPEDVNKSCLLHHYVSSQTAEEDIILKLLQLGADTSKHNKEGFTVLNCAIETRDLKLVKFLVTNAGADVNVTDGDGDSALSLAVAKGEEEICKYLLECGADVNLGTNWSPLIKACETGDLEMAKLLVTSYGADVDGGYDCGSPIAAASFWKRGKLIEYLLEQGVKRDDQALYNAIERGNLSLVKFLMKRGFGASGETASQKTALSCAITNGSKKIVKFILDSGARVDEKTIDGKFPIHYAAENYDKEVVELLLNYGADINAEYDGKTPLMIGMLEIIYTYYCLTKYLVEQVALMESQGLLVSEVNLNIAKTKFASFYNESVNELELLKSEKFDDSYLSYLDVYMTKDVEELAALARNKSIRETIKSDDFMIKFPVYGEMIVKHFDKGLLRSACFLLLRKFFNHLSTRETDKLPKLPFIVLSRLVTYFSNKNIAVLINFKDQLF